MKKYFLLLLTASLFAACRREVEYDLPDALGGSFSSVTASLARADMSGVKSVCNPQVESFVEAYLFAFYADGESVCSVKHVTQADSFSWTLPRGEDLEIWALANPQDDALKETLESFLTATDLTRQDLLNLPPFTCTSSADLKALEDSGRNLPMSAVVTAHFNGVRETVTIPMERLFAKYSLKLNCSLFIRDGWSIRTAFVRCMNSNGRVPYFYDGAGAGYAARAEDLVPCLDHDNSGQDLVFLSLFGRNGVTGKSVTFYFPENCQGTILSEDGKPAQSWKTVSQELGCAVSACSYLSINIVASKDGVERSFSYRVYPGSESMMNRNFDIVRNTARTLTVTLTPGLETDSFRWMPTQTISVEPGGTIEIPFETSLESPSFSVLGNGLAWVETVDGVARYRAAADAPEGTVYALGGDEGFEVSDRVPVTISDRYKLKGTIPSGLVFYQPFQLKISPFRDDWPDAVSPSSLTLSSTAPSGQEAIDVLSGPRFGPEGWYFDACCTGPRSAADPSETLLIRDGENNVLGEVLIPDVREVFGIPAIYYDGPTLTADGCFVLPVNGADCATLNLQFETEDGADVTIPDSRLSLVSSDTAVDDLYVEYADNTFDVYLPYWEGIPGLQEFNQSHISSEPYLQSVSNALRLHSKTGYVFHSEEITFLIPNPFVGFDAEIPHARVVSGNKVEMPADWILRKEPGGVLEWHIDKDRSRPALTVETALLNEDGYLDSSTTYTAAPTDGSGRLLPYDIVRIPCDFKTCGQISFRLEVENVRSGEKASACAAIVDVVRELEIYATFLIHQRRYPMFSPYDDEAKIAVNASFLQMTALNPIVGMDFLKTTATANTTVHPTKAEAETLGPYWVNYFSSVGANTFFGSGTRYVLSDSDLRYEIQWSPSSATDFFNYRVITLWNPPQFDFDLDGFRQKHPGAFPNMHLVPASGDMCRYLQMDDYTRIVLFWERWKSAGWTDGGKGWYLCENPGGEPAFASAYYMPRAEIDPFYGRTFFGNPSQTGTDVDPVYGGDPFFIQSSSNTFETILDY